MIAVVTSCSYDAAILPHFLRHYEPHADLVFVAVNELVPGVRRDVEERARPWGSWVRIIEASDRWRRTGIEGNNKEESRRLIGLTASDWMVPADLDEFHRFPARAADMADEASREGWEWAAGWFVDRVAASGLLEPMTDGIPLSEQYPLELRVTRDVVLGAAEKVVLVRGDVPVTSGHHTPRRFTRPRRPEKIPIDHYKWRAGLLEALERRVRIYESHNSPWSGESKRFLEHYARHGRILVD